MSDVVVVRLDGGGADSPTVIARLADPTLDAARVVAFDAYSPVWSGGGPPTGGAGGALSGSYPNPGFAVDMATQAELAGHNTSSTAHADIRALLAAVPAHHHEQPVAAHTWTITHNLGFHPAGVVARDAIGLIEPDDITYPDVNTCVLSWSGRLVSGSADLS